MFEKSLYRKVMFIISILCLILLTVIAVKIGIFSNLNIDSLFNVVKRFLENTYFNGTMCSIIAVIIIYTVQVQYSKVMLKKDFRCNEIIQDIFDGIENYCKFANKIPKRSEKKDNENYDEKNKRDSLKFYEFYKENKVDIMLVTLSFSNINNNILIDSLQSCFFLNLNFKLLSIVNNIKNRLPNLQKDYPEIEKEYEQYTSSKDEAALKRFGYRLPHYLIDLRCMAIYWKELLDYLNYDPTYIKLFIQTYNSKYDIAEDIKQPKEVLYAQNREIDKIVKKAMRKYKIKHFWDK